MMKKKQRRKTILDKSICRHKSCYIRFRLNSSEYMAIEQYCQKFKIDNRTEWIRTTLMRQVFEDYYATPPSLFDEPME